MRTKVTGQAGQVLRGKSLLAALALALVVSVGVASHAGAQRPPSGGDSHQRQCRSIYDAAERLRSEYLQVSLANPNSPRLDEIIAEGRVLGQDWIALKCKDRYGSIAHLIVNPVRPITKVPLHPITTDDPANSSPPLLNESSPTIIFADITLEPATELVLAPVSNVAPATELAPVPEAEVIPVPESDGNVIGSIPYSPPSLESEEIPVPEHAPEGDVVGSVPYSPSAGEVIPVPEQAPEAEVIGSTALAPEVEQP